MNNTNNATAKATALMLQKFNNRFNKSQRETEQVLSDWANYLSIEKCFTVNQIGFALSELMKKGSKFMPSAYEIEAELSVVEPSKEDIAPIVAREIISLIRSFHQLNENEMMEAASLNAKMVLKAIGSTSDIRGSENFETTLAQIERLVRGVISQGRGLVKNERLELIGISSKEEMSKVEFKGFV